MAICPADGHPCIDDLCYGGGCLRLGGEPMRVPCPGCGQLIAADGSDTDDCDCEPCEEDESDRYPEYCAGCGKESDALMNQLCPMCFELQGGVDLNVKRGWP
jgi:hypothetical protein